MLTDSFGLNTRGRDFVVGDIHGCFGIVYDEMLKVAFDENIDRLFSVGDLVDRGPGSEDALDWLAKPWFHPVRGNHEQMAIDAYDGCMDSYNHVQNGGRWYYNLNKDQQKMFADSFRDIPIAITVETLDGPIGLVHAEPSTKDWNTFLNILEDVNHNQHNWALTSAMWNRDRIQGNYNYDIENIFRVIVGHTPLDDMTRVGNVIYIDTGACFNGGKLTMIEI